MRDKEIDKKKFLKHLRETGNVVNSCFKAKIPKSTVYRWRLEDNQFLLDFEEAQDEGRFVMSSIAEGVVIKNIKKENQRAAEFFLKHNDTHYARKPVLSAEETLPLSTRRAVLILDVYERMKVLERDYTIEDRKEKKEVLQLILSELLSPSD